MKLNSEPSGNSSLIFDLKINYAGGVLHWRSVNPKSPDALPTVWETNLLCQYFPWELCATWLLRTTADDTTGSGAGINHLETARGYGKSEQYLGSKI